MAAAPQPHKRDRAATRAALLDAARVRFARLGFDGTTMRDVAQDAHVDPALVFRYFGSKRALFEEACVDHQVLGEIMSGPLDALPVGMLKSVVFQEWEQFAGEHPLVMLLRSPSHAPARNRLEQEAQAAAHIEELIKQVKGEDAALRAEMLVACLLGMGIMRTALRSPALNSASLEDVLPYFEGVTRVLIENAGDAPDDGPRPD
ncbi:TetR/AcrR family transcriptional regulator [Streptomyces sp. GESEQ-35]|uniref:TetR/AcrR family transcriptional regulator n=1 Tax=Streptomyces sp. GESEQ-35 TaxID=2812657 RepID=UPI001B31CBDF|nr:TetR/AcrR family transcriptional regulator [Streptomyces sp. GESEQ-35]